MAYGIKIKNIGGDILILTSSIISIVSAGRIAMPAGLNGDDTYGIDINLPGVDAISEESLGVLVKSFRVNIDLFLNLTNINDGYAMSWLMNNTFTFYTRNEATGVMTVWTPDMSAPDYDACLSAYRVAFWDKMGATTFTQIRIFAATCYIIYDQSAGTYKKVYSIGAQGIENVDYAIYMKKYSGNLERVVQPVDALAIAENIVIGVV